MTTYQQSEFHVMPVGGGRRELRAYQQGKLELGSEPTFPEFIANLMEVFDKLGEAAATEAIQPALERLAGAGLNTSPATEMKA